jgi:hypothetical protein
MVETHSTENGLMKDIIHKLKSLIYGKNVPLESNRNSVIIEDSESLNKKAKYMKRSCSCTKIISDNTSRTRSANCTGGLNTGKYVNDYSDTYGTNIASSMIQSKLLKSNRSVAPSLANI